MACVPILNSLVHRYVDFIFILAVESYPMEGAVSLLTADLCFILGIIADPSFFIIYKAVDALQK